MSLPSIPSTFTGDFKAVSSYETPVKRPIEPVGQYFLAHATRTLKGHTWSEFEKIEASKNVKKIEEVDNDEELFDDEQDAELLSHDPRDWKSCDLYAALSLSKLRYKATEEQIVKAHRKSVLKHHPDKKGTKGGLDQDGFFKIIQKAFETIMDPAKRRQFDSVDKAAEVAPPPASKKANSEEEFLELWYPVFESESRFSNRQPVPSLGSKDSTKEEVESFYKFWNNFDSWRTFEFLDEDVPDDTSNRDHKRYIEKKNNNARKKKKTDDNKRLSDLVKRASNEDPRLKRFKEEDKAEKAKKKWEREAGTRKALEEAKAKQEAELKAKQEAEVALKADKESAKKAKEAAKNAKKKNKRAIRNAAKDHEYFGDSDKSAAIDGDIEILLELFDDMQIAEVSGKLKEANAESAKTVLAEIANELISNGKASSLSYFV